MTDAQIDTFGLHILCIDDSRAQLALYKSQLEGMYRVTAALTYQEAVACLSSSPPDLIILDMEMPQVKGLEFLDILRYTPNYAGIPVIIVSGDERPEDIKQAFIRGAEDYVRKPYDPEELSLRIARLFRLILGPRKAKAESESISAGKAQDLLVRSLADLASARDNEGTRHLERMGPYCAVLARNAAKTAKYRPSIHGDFVERIEQMAKLHDIGKVNVPDYVLHNPEALHGKEFELIKKHTADGSRTVDMIRLSFPDYGFLDFAHDIILYHHENWDGTGYPEGKSGNGIPVSARIVALADVFDAVTTKRVFREARSFEEGAAIVESESGKRLDPDLVEVFTLSLPELREIYERLSD